MVKSRQRHLTAALENNSNTELYLNEDEDWVIVKKQKVTILVPSLPTANKSTMPTLGPSQRQASPRKAINKQSQYSTDACSKKPIVDEQEKSASLAPKRGIHIARKTPNLYVPAIAKPPLVDSRMEPENPVHARGSVSRYTLGVMDMSRTIRCSRTFHGISGSLDRSMLLNQRLRALNLERKLQKAGGLSRWLASLGLGQFVRLFQRKSINKFQLVNLNMKKLKDMGADAVGPRRKLMHAIECVCQPYCFEAL
ncbi:uncharacterized protein LOC116142311 [Pistacia vera]|uniref:uncharacterized protein LOC116142311 n=1 Tax=Pistacia vera TaxID=55513 RepID=UPI001262B59A|nr:uncharacterized protein LOC116142311 [Pistacia vera]